MANVTRNRLFLAESDRLQTIAAESPKAVKRAVSTLARSLPVVARRDIQDEYRLGSKRIAQDLLARAGAGFVDLVGRRRPIGLLQYGAKWGGATRSGDRKKGARTAAPVSARIKVGASPQTFPGAFIARGLNGNLHVFYRAGGKRAMQQGRNRGRVKQPLVAITEGSIAEYLIESGRPDRLADFARTKLADELSRLTGRDL